MSYTELHITSNFSFLRGGSHPEELVEQAAGLGYTALAITDHNTLAGIVRAHVAAKKAGMGLQILSGNTIFRNRVNRCYQELISPSDRSNKGC